MSAPRHHWRITIKEVGRQHLIHTSHIGSLQYAEVIAFFGLNNPDVEWYEVKEIPLPPDRP